MIKNNPTDILEAGSADANYVMLEQVVIALTDENTRLAALLEQAQQVAVPAWMPIETAPMDGKCLLWVDTEDGGEVMTLLRDSNGCWLYEGEPTYSASFFIQPTHWLPLPQPPQGDRT